MIEESRSPLPAPLRRERMLAFIGEHGFARVGELSDTFDVSEVTVRGDLDELDRLRAVTRVHGGAVVRGAGKRELSFEESLESSAEEKRAIAATAVAMIEPGMSILLDVGTTTAAIARAIVENEELHDVTVITNGLSLALELERAIPRIQVVVTGGTLRPLQHSLVAPFADLLLERLHTDLAFIGCNGVHPTGGVTNVNLAETEIKRAMVASVTRPLVVADGSKLGQIHLGLIAPATTFAGILTDASADASVVADLRAAGTEVTTARER